MKHLKKSFLFLLLTFCLTINAIANQPEFSNQSNLGETKETIHNFPTEANAELNENFGEGLLAQKTAPSELITQKQKHAPSVEQFNKTNQPELPAKEVTQVIQEEPVPWWRMHWKDVVIAVLGAALTLATSFGKGTLVTIINFLLGFLDTVSVNQVETRAANRKQALSDLA